MGFLKKQKVFRTLFTGLVIVLSYFSWQEVFQSISHESQSGWGMPFMLFSLFAVALGVYTFLAKDGKEYFLVVLLSFFSGVLFAFRLEYVLTLLFGSILVFLGRERILTDMRERTVFNARKSLRYGFSLIIFAYAFAISMLSFFIFLDRDPADLMPDISFQKESQQRVGKALATLHPGFRELEKENVTVDEFFVSLSQDEKAPANIGSPSDEEILNASSEWKKQLSQFVGKPVEGDEPIHEILSSAVSAQAQKYFPISETSTTASVLPFVFALIIFLTIISLCALAKYIWFFLMSGVLWILKKTNCITTEKVSLEVERIKMWE